MPAPQGYIIPEFNHSPHVIPFASPTAPGVMSPAQAAAVANLSPNGFGLLNPFLAPPAPFSNPYIVPSTTPSGSMIFVLTGGGNPAQKLFLFAFPVGTVIYIKDGGNGGANPINVQGNIDGGTSVSINTNNGCWGFVSTDSTGNGTWAILSKF